MRTKEAFTRMSGSRAFRLTGSGAWLLAGLVALGLTIYAVPSASGGLYQQPRMWPGAAATIMIIAGVYILVSGVVANRPTADVPAAEGSDHDSAEQGGEVRQPLGHVYVVGAIIAYLLALDWIGYIISTFLLALAIMFAMRARRVLVVLTVSIIVALGTAYLFGELLGVALPRGNPPLDVISRMFY